MDKGEMTMNTIFRSSVEKKLADFLSREGLVYQEEKIYDSGNQISIFYKSSFCKLSIYRSIRNGEVNAMLAGINSPNNNKLDDGWKYLNSLVNDKNYSIDRLLLNVPNAPKSFDDQLDEVVNKIVINFHSILKTISLK